MSPREVLMKERAVWDFAWQSGWCFQLWLTSAQPEVAKGEFVTSQRSR